MTTQRKRKQHGRAAILPAAARALVAERGWTIAALARRWHISRKHLYEVLQDAARPPHWTDALGGLPLRAELPLEEQQRVVRRPARPRPKRAPKGRFLQGIAVVGTVVVVEHDLGDDAPEGARGVIIAIDDPTPPALPRFRIAFATGWIAWFEQEYFRTTLATIGIDLAQLAHYRPTGSDAEITAYLVRAGAFRQP